MIKTFCDVCKNELNRNMVSDRLIVEQGDFKADVYVENTAGRAGDLCLDCLLKMLNLKPKRKYVRKQPAEQAVIEKTTKKARKVKVRQEIADKKGDNLTIHVPTGLGNDVKYKVNIAGKEVSGFAIKETIMTALSGYDGKIPDFLSDYEKKLLRGILDA